MLPVYFFMLISLGVSFMHSTSKQDGHQYCLEYAGITSYLPVGSVIFFFILILCGLHFNLFYMVRS
jgi:hypothetical protein